MSGAAAVEPAAAERAASAGPAPRRLYLRGTLDLDSRDLLWCLALLVVAFVIRFYSPLMPDFIAHPLQGPAISNCVNNTPVDAQGTPGTLCGLAYPFQRGYAQPGQPPQPPEGEVFDEIYFGVFAHDDLKGVQYFDPEPPSSKLVIAGGEWLYGWWRATFGGFRGDYADLGFNTFGWRLMPCLFGSLTVPLMYLFARRLWYDRRFFAIAAGVLTCFDGMFFVQSRIGMIDMIPIFLIILGYLLFLVHLRSSTFTRSLVTLFVAGAVSGIAISSKWIALAAWASMLFLLLMRWLRRRIDLGFGAGEARWAWGRGEGPAVPGGVPLAVYVPALVLAFVALPLAIYIGSWFPFFARHQFHDLVDLWNYQKQIYLYHATLTATHPYGSPWYSWPFLARPVAYYFENQGLGTDQFTGHNLVAGMVNLGDPFIWWTSLPCLLLLPVWIFRDRSFPASLIAIGFVTQYLPWSRITRVIFLYHMFGGLIFMVLALAYTLGRLSGTAGFTLTLGARGVTVPGRALAIGYLVIAVAFFAYFYPVWTGTPISDGAYLDGFPNGKMWFPSWI